MYSGSFAWNSLRLTAFASSPERGSFLHARKLCGCAENFAAMPRPLPLGEVASHSDDGEGELACAVVQPCGSAQSRPLGGKVAANAVSRRKGHSTAPPRFRRKQALQMQFPAATPRVKRQFWKIRRFSRIANLKIYFPLIMRRATRSAFKIVLCPAGERTQKMLPLAGEQIRHTTPNYAE